MADSESKRLSRDPLDRYRETVWMPLQEEKHAQVNGTKTHRSVQTAAQGNSEEDSLRGEDRVDWGCERGI